jgi:hypothetical protein
MALIAVASDKGAPGVTTAAVALAAVWPRPVLLAECDPSGGDVLYRLPGADGNRLEPRRGVLSLAVAARKGMQPRQVWEHAQKLRGGLDVLVGVGSAEQGAGLDLLWGQLGGVLARVPQADVIADCGRLGVDGPVYDLLAWASSIVLLSRATLEEVVRLRDRAGAVVSAVAKRGRSSPRIDVVAVTPYKKFTTATAEVEHALRQGRAPARVLGAIAHEPKSAEQLRGEWTGRLDKSMFIRTTRAIAADLAAALPVLAPEPQAAQAPPVSATGSGAPRRPPSPRSPATGQQSPPGHRGTPGQDGQASPAASLHRDSVFAARRSPATPADTPGLGESSPRPGPEPAAGDHSPRTGASPGAHVSSRPQPGARGRHASLPTVSGTAHDQQPRPSETGQVTTQPSEQAPDAQASRPRGR